MLPIAILLGPTATDVGPGAVNGARGGRVGGTARTAIGRRRGAWDHPQRVLAKLLNHKEKVEMRETPNSQEPLSNLLTKFTFVPNKLKSSQVDMHLLV